MYDVAIIGAGGAGTMAYLRAVLNGNRAVLFTGDARDKKRGRATWVTEVDNIPGMHAATRPILQSTTSTLKWLAGREELEDFGQIIKAKVSEVRRAGDHFELEFTKRKELATIEARHVVLATGVMDVQPMIGGSIEPIFPYANRGEVIYCVRCDGHRTLGHRLSVIGRSDSAIHIATMMMDRYRHERVDVLTHGEPGSFSAEALESAKLYGLDFHEEEIVAVHGDEESGLAGFELAGGLRVRCERCIVSLGVIVYNELLTTLGGAVDAVGKAIVDENYETSVPGLYVVGDLVAGKKMQIYTAWDEAVDAADAIDRKVRARKREARRAQVS